MLKAKVLSRVALAAIAVALLAAPVAAKLKSCSQSLTVCGVDTSGCLSLSLGSKCTTKCYTDTDTGICTSTTKCSVWNKCGSICSFENQGCSIKDAITSKLHTCTSDVQICTKPTKWNSKLKCWDRTSCTLTCCYNPCAPVEEPPAE